MARKNQKSQQERNILSGDPPLMDPKDDRLGYAPFAKHLAISLCKMVPVEGMVISINGPWGSGKTTILNFIVYYLEQVSEKDKPKIVHFNPWWFSGDQDLVTKFFDEMMSTLNPEDKAGRKILEGLSTLCKIVGSAPIPYGKTIAEIGETVKPRNESLHKIRKKIEQLLIDENVRFIVVIDDIDRLVVNEIRDIFKVVKAVANLPNMIYILAFDRGRVAKAFEEFYLGSGKEYLDKIVQLPFDLPLPDKASISQLLFERLDKALGHLDDSDFDQQRWANIYLDGIEPLIYTPRDVIRLCNTISVTFPSVRGEVNPVDFIAIEAIRVFAPEVYETIRMNREEFTGTSQRDSGSNQEAKQKFHESYLKNIDVKLREPIELLLQRLFPKLEKISYASDFESRWRLQMRVCSDEVFSVYFRLQLAEGDIGAGDIRKFLDISSKREEVVKYLQVLIGQKHRTGITRARALLERLEDYTEKAIPEKDIKPILLALFDVGEELRATEPYRIKMFDIGVEMQVARIVYQLLKRMSENDRFDLMKTAINEGQGFVTAIYEVSLLDEMIEKTKESNNSSKDDILLPSVKVEELKNLAVDRITNESEKGSILKCLKLSFILYCWKMWDKSNKYQGWVNRMKSRRDFIVPLLTSCLGVRFSAGMGFFGLGDRVAKREYRIDLEFIKEFVELNEIKPIVESALKERNLSDRERLAIETFLKELQHPEDLRGKKVDEK
jgi:predicted KAP-like P-loop ATPase